MFCDRCGRLLNRATGQCVCESDPSLATPVQAPAAPTDASWAPLDTPLETGTTTVTTTLTRTATPPGWYEDPHGEAAHRWWDGGAWTANVSHPRQPEQTWIAAIPRVLYKHRYYDLYLFADRAVAVRQRTDGASMLGFAAGGLIGAFIGQHVEASRSRDRLMAHRYETADALALSPKSRTFVLNNVIRVNARSFTGGGRIHLHTNRAKHRIKWQRPYISDENVQGALQQTFNERLSWRPRSTTSKVITRTGLGLVGLLIAIRLVFTVLGFAGVLGPEPVRRPQTEVQGSTAFDRGCAGWFALAEDIDGLNATEIAARMSVVRADFDQAATVDVNALGAAGAASQVEQWFVAASTAASPAEALPIQQLRAPAERVDQACGVPTA